MLVRKYPIRTTRDKWEIRLYSKHICSDKCSEIITNLPNSNIFVISKNPNHVCNNLDKVLLSSVKISEFNKDFPNTIDGTLLNSDDVIIPDSRIRLIIGFPLTTPLEAVLTTDENGFTLKNLLQSIKNIYEYVYNEEERTASVNTYKLFKICTDCASSDFQKYLKDCIYDEEQKECSICFDGSKNDFVMLECGHKFHKNCILEWLKNGSNCPLCRKSIKQCDLCNGTFIIYYDYVGKVIPIEQRGILLNRNCTDGKFGIYAYDFHDLLIKTIKYDRKNKIVTLNLEI